MLQSAYLLNCIQEFMFASTDVYLHLVRYQPVKGYGGLKKTPISLVESMLCHVRSTLKDPTSYFHWCLSPKNQSYKTSQPGDINIVGEGVHTPPPFSKISPFLKFKMSPPSIGLSRKQKYLITLVTNLYIISNLKVS